MHSVFVNTCENVNFDDPTANLKGWTKIGFNYDNGFVVDIFMVFFWGGGVNRLSNFC